LTNQKNQIHPDGITLR